MQDSRLALKVFGSSLVVTLGGLAAVWAGLGLQAALVALVLIAVEVIFSFDNAIINAKVLGRLPVLWQQLFLTLGVVIAIFGMRVVFPIGVIAIATHAGWHDVLNLALHHPAAYAHKLNQAHVSIAAFGGAFLLMLALEFFLDDDRQELWLERLERRLQRLSKIWLAPPATLAVVTIITLLPANHAKRETFFAGVLGAAVYWVIQLVNFAASGLQRRGAHGGGVGHGFGALLLFLYLEVLDASFSFDSVIGAFAITDKLVLIAAGLGIGALWVRSLTVYMVRHQVLRSYKYLEHGAHYAILVLAVTLLVSVLKNVPDMVAGVTGLAIVAAALYTSRKSALSQHIAE